LTLIVLVALILFGTRLSSFAEHHLYMDQVVFSEQTPYQKVIFTQSPANGNYRMYIDGHIQFSQRDEHRYHEALVHPVMSLPGPKENILILGGGDGLAAREVLKYDKVKSITLIDIDPAITSFSASFPALVKMNGDSLNNPKVTVINGDAFSFINQPGKLYDRVIIDMPDPHNEALNKLYSREFYRMIKHRLHPDGVMVTQSSSPFFARRTFWSIAATLNAAGLQTYSYQLTVPSFGIWGFHLASNRDIHSDDFTISVPTQYLTEQTLAAASVFGKDIAPIEVPINTMLEPKLYTLYVADLRK
jgi:spermidine synthase